MGRRVRARHWNPDDLREPLHPQKTGPACDRSRSPNRAFAGSWPADSHQHTHAMIYRYGMRLAPLWVLLPLAACGPDSPSGACKDTLLPGDLVITEVFADFAA